MEVRVNHSASPFLTFLFSLLPGAGHMYLGLMRRGIEIMLVFFSSIFIVANLFRFVELGVPLSIVIFFYSLFDAHHLRKSITKGNDVADESLIKFRDSSFKVNEYHIGIGVILLGLVLLINRIGIYSGFLNHSTYIAIQRATGPVILIILGLFLVIRSRGVSKNIK